ncbi:O-methyltransferase [Prolixibacter bellariivorans]|uniref:O-methyltransferase n=1 Tax=Prolixibacter bellariivorans TaxID=314319 RepID=A0A5M4AWM9_9BACT|nr:O-methyltransferase [Prolixibacter bellariivorans]GET32329.1 O-methyltransferase [Prolixibacter bellariivorans]
MRLSIDLENYILEHIEEEDPVLAQLNRDTHAKQLYARMCSGHLQGSILTLLSKLIEPKRILELGTFTGYSALCLAKGLQSDGVLHTIEINDELEDFAAHYFDLAGMRNRIVQHIGDASTILPTFDEPFDLIFMDADKRSYPEHYEMIVPLVREGGIIIADNTLWDQKVLDEEISDEQTAGILRFNDLVKNDSRVETYLFPVRDGLTVLRKKGTSLHSGAL